LGQAHEAPGQQQVVEEPRTVKRIQVDEDRELQRQGQRRRAGQRGCHRHGHIAPPVLLCAHGSVHASVISLKATETYTRAAFRPETTWSDLKRRLPPYHHRSLRGAGPAVYRSSRREVAG